MDQRPEKSLEVAVVDDDPAVRDSLATIFDLEGFRVQAYSCGRAFLDALPAIDPDCVLLDVHMPCPNGLEVLESIGGGGIPRR